jgi:hypothetical protein
MIYNNNEGEYGKYIVQTLHQPDMITLDFSEMYKKFATRLLWIDGDEVPGAFQMNTAWWKKAQPRDPLFPEHVHDHDELIGFFSSDPEDPYTLNAVIEFTIEDEIHRIDRSSLIFVPGGIRHNPLRLLEVEKPIFHFSVVMSPQYAGEKIYK